VIFLKIYFKSISIILIFILLLLTLTGCNNDNGNILNEKVKEELYYLDIEIVSLINSLNNITIENYKIATQEVNLGESTSSSNASSSQSTSTSSSASEQGRGEQQSEAGGDSNGGEDSSQNGSGSGGSGEGGSGSSGSGSGGGSGSGSSGGQSPSGTTSESTEKIEVTELLTKNIIGEDKEVNWNLIKSRIENLYSIWSTISIDLAELNIPEDKINSFNTVLNETTLQIKEEKKSESIQKLVDLYECVITLYNSFDNNMSNNDKKLKEIKYNIIIAYENVEMEKWDEARTYVAEAQNINTAILNNLEEMNSYNIKKINIILNQINSSLDTKDKEIFYINYKNLIEEINLM